jgi:hypothetical protein
LHFANLCSICIVEVVVVVVVGVVVVVVVVVVVAEVEVVVVVVVVVVVGRYIIVTGVTHIFRLPVLFWQVQFGSCVFLLFGVRPPWCSSTQLLCL